MSLLILTFLIDVYFNKIAKWFGDYCHKATEGFLTCLFLNKKEFKILLVDKELSTSR